MPLNYTLVEKDVTVEANGTTIHGCDIFEGSATILDETYTGTAAYHPAIGLVSGSISWPPPIGVSATFNGVTDFGEVINGYLLPRGERPGLPVPRLLRRSGRAKRVGEPDRLLRRGIQRWRLRRSGARDHAPAL